MQLWADYNEFAMWASLRHDRLRLRHVPSLACQQPLSSNFPGRRMRRLRRPLFLEPLSMYQKIRAIHLSTTLFALIFLLAFALSAVDFAHRKWFPHLTNTFTETRNLTPASPTRESWPSNGAAN